MALAPALADPKATDSALRLVWIACGKNDRLVENARRLSEVLKVTDTPRASYEGGRPSLVALSSLPGGDPPPPVCHQVLILPFVVPQQTVSPANRPGVV